MTVANKIEAITETKMRSMGPPISGILVDCLTRLVANIPYGLSCHQSISFDHKRISPESVLQEVLAAFFGLVFRP